GRVFHDATSSSFPGNCRACKCGLALSLAVVKKKSRSGMRKNISLQGSSNTNNGVVKVIQIDENSHLQNLPLIEKSDCLSTWSIKVAVWRRDNLREVAIPRPCWS